MNAKNESTPTPRQTTPPTFLTIKQLSQRWQRHKRSILRDIEAGDLTPHRFGKSVRIHIDDVLAYEAKRRSKRR